MNPKIDLSNIDRIQIDGQIEFFRSANHKLTDAMQRQGGSSSVGRASSEVRLIDVKAMKSNKSDGKLDTPYRACPKAVRAYCNASRPDFRKYFR